MEMTHGWMPVVGRMTLAIAFNPHVVESTGLLAVELTTHRSFKR